MTEFDSLTRSKTLTRSNTHTRSKPITPAKSNAQKIDIKTRSLAILSIDASNSKGTNLPALLLKIRGLPREEQKAILENLGLAAPTIAAYFESSNTAHNPGHRETDTCNGAGCNCSN